MLTPQFILGLSDSLLVDLFAGGGGMSCAIEQATGRHVDIAANHDDDATSMHRVNHPQTRHFVADIYEVNPRGATGGKRVGLLHLSPDCTDHSQAKGGQPRSKKIRGLTWVGYRWAGQVRPDVITLENVKQILRWGPLVAKRDALTGRVVKLDGSVAAKGERVPVREQFLVPDKKRAGSSWTRFVKLLRELGYQVEWKTLVAADFGAPTTRERLFMVARCDGEPISWPTPTHAKNPQKGQKKWRAAAECIDWSLPCPSIFGRQKPLADATLRRVAKGIKRYVLDSAEPFIVPATHRDESDRSRGLDEPLPTITGANRGELMLAAPTLAKFRFDSAGARVDDPMPTITGGGDCQRPAGAAHAMGLVAAHLQQVTQSGRNHGAEKPLPTITTARGGEQTVVAAHLSPFYGIKADETRSGDASDPMRTQTGDPKFGLVAATMVQASHGDGKPGGVKRWGDGAPDIKAPVGAITGSGSGGHALAAATLVQTGYGERAGQAPRALDPDQPLGTIVSGGKHAAVTAFLEQANTGLVGHDAREPMSTIVGKGCTQRVVTALLAQHNGERDGGVKAGRDAREPVSTILGDGVRQSVVTAQLAHLRGNCDARDAGEPLRTVSAAGQHHGVIAAHLAAFGENAAGTDPRDPAQTVMAGAQRYGVCAATLLTNTTNHTGTDLNDPASTITTGNHQAVVECTLSAEAEQGALRVAAFLMRYYGEGGQWGELNQPLATMTTRDRLALVTVVIKGTPYVIVDIGLRMLQPPELYRAQGFPASYVIDRGHDGRRFPKSAQVRMCGNSVSPPPAEALIRANYRPRELERRAA